MRVRARVRSVWRVKVLGILKSAIFTVLAFFTAVAEGERPPTHRLLTYPLEVKLHMQIPAKLLQRTLGGGGNRGLL